MLNMSHIACFVLYSILLGSSFARTQKLYQVYPSEYAYRNDSVTRAENASANCRSYPSRDGNRGIVYIHCDGDQLKLSDSERGSSMEYTNTSYYVWNARGHAQLLFIFPTRVSLTTITLHYYSDSVRGRPRLIFYSVPDEFNVWDSPINAPLVGIPSVPDPIGGRNVKIKVNFYTKKVLMSKLNSSLQFAASEVEFFTNKEPITTLAMTNYQASSNQDEIEILMTEKANPSLSTITSSVTDSTTSVVQSNINIIAIGVSIVMLLILSTILIITATVLIWSYKRRSSKQVNNSSPYSSLNRRAGQPQSLQQVSPELYDQIHLSMSPSTGQAEYIPDSETANINNPSQTSQYSHPTYSTAGGDITEHSSTLNAGNQAITSQLSPQNAHESTSEQPTYAAVDTSKKKKLNKQTEKKDPKNEAAKKGPPVLPYSGYEVPMQEKKENVTITSSHSIIEQLYTAVKKPKDCEPKDEEETPPIPLPHTVEDLYTVVQKKPKSKSNADGNKDETPLADDTETAPPIPPHTVEELYTAIVKKPKGNKKEAPPIPPYI